MLSLVLGKRGLFRVRKLMSQISLCNMHMLIKDDTFRLNWIVAKKALPWDEICHGLYVTSLFAYALSPVFPKRESNWFFMLSLFRLGHWYCLIHAFRLSSERRHDFEMSSEFSSWDKFFICIVCESVNRCINALCSWRILVYIYMHK